MAVVKTDSFTTAGDQHLHDYNANWKDNNGSVWTVLGASDDALCDSWGTNNENACHWEGNVFNDNQYAQGVLNAVTGNCLGVAVRVASGTTGTYYAFYLSSNDHFLIKNVGSTVTELKSDTTNGAVGEVLRLEVSGTTLTPKINGAVWAQGNITDASIGSGYAGLAGWQGSTSERIDDFEGGNLGLPAYDSFTDTDNVELSAHSANWTRNDDGGSNGDARIYSNKLRPNTSASTDIAYHWNASSFSNNQYAKATWAKAGTSAATIGVAVRVASGNTRTYYLFYSDGSSSGENALWLEKIINNVETDLGSPTNRAYTNFEIKITADGTTITPYVNGSTTGTPGAQTDESISSGYAGIALYNSDTSEIGIDDWEGGDLGGECNTVVIMEVNTVQSPVITRTTVVMQG